MYPPGELRKRLRSALDADSVFTPMEGAVPSAVLVPVIAGEDEVRLVFTKRTDTLSRHAGEISFPGGLADPGESPFQTALRETEEELGVRAEDIEVLGGLPPVHTRVTGMLISPVVGLLEREPRFTPNAAEIASVLVLPLDDLATLGREDTIEWEGRSYATYVFETGGHTIWGATARILRTFLDALESPGTPAMPSDEELTSMLGDARTIAVVGLSSKPDRPSHQVAAYLQSKGYRIIPVNPGETRVLGETSYPSLLDVPEKIDAVDVFRRADHTPEVARQSVAVGAKVLWLQEGIVNEEARRIAAEGGLEVVMGACMMRTHERLAG